MKLAVLSESPADEAAVRILVSAILGRTTEEITIPKSIRTRGWTSVCPILPAVIKSLHFGTDAEALVIVLDSDTSPVHHPDHDVPGQAVPKCRLCEVRKTAATALTGLRSRPSGDALRLAFGLAVPCLEAWFRCGRDPQVTEAAWAQALGAKKPLPYDAKGLKSKVYGKSHSTMEHITHCMTAESQRLATILPQLEAAFSIGFGQFAQAIRNWPSTAGRDSSHA